VKRLPAGATARTPLANLQAAVAPLLYGANGQPVQSGGVTDPFHGREPGPGTPLSPRYDEAPPRSWFPWAGYNLAYIPRSEFKNLTPYTMLRNLADLCDVVAACINDVKQQILGLTVEFKAKDKTSQTQASEIEAVKDFFRWPDGENDFSTWLSMMLDEVLVTDALSYYRHRTVAGDPFALRMLDGATIKPLVDYLGMAPAPPAPAYQQIVMGAVESEFTRPWRTSDRRAPDGSQKHELVYAPFSKKTTGPYGQSPVERVLMTVNLILRRQQHYLSFYTEGNIPDAFWKCPDTWTAEQIGTAQQIFDEMLVGNAAVRSRMKLMPGGEGTGLENPRGDDKFSREYEELLYAVVSYHFNVSSQPYRQMMNRATAEQADVAETDSGLKPLTKRIKMRLDTEIEHFLGYAGVEATWSDAKGEDEKLKLEKNLGYYNAGVYTRAEVRESEGKPALTPEQEAELDGAVPGGLGVPPVPGAPAAPGAPRGNARATLAAAPPIPILQDRLSAPELTRTCHDDLKRWRKVALKAVAGGRTVRPFESATIPPVLRTALEEWLGHATTAEDVRWGFAALTRARRPLLQARTRIRLERGLRRTVLAHFKEHAPAIAALAREFYPGAQVERDEVAPKLPPGGTIPDERIDAAMDYQVLVRDVVPELERAFAQGGELAAEQVAKVSTIEFGLTDQEAVDYAEARAAEMVGMRRMPDGSLVPNPNAEWAISKTVREKIHDTVAQAVKEGWTGKQLADELEDGPIWATRADAIARSEVAIAVNQGAAETYKEVGVEDGTVLDGPGCLEDGHDDSQAGVNGETWTLQRFMDNPIGHPHCRRDFVPNVPVAAAEAA
jgi:hypothetical protein